MGLKSTSHNATVPSLEPDANPSFVECIVNIPAYKDYQLLLIGENSKYHILRQALAVQNLKHPNFIWTLLFHFTGVIFCYYFCPKCLKSVGPKFSSPKYLVTNVGSSAYYPD